MKISLRVRMWNPILPDFVCEALIQTIQLFPYLLSLIPITNPISNPKIPLQPNIQTELQNQYKAKTLQFQ